MPEFSTNQIEGQSVNPYRREKHEVLPEIKEKALAEYKKKKNSLIIAAIKKHIEAVSSRAIRVGSAVLAYNSRMKDGYDVRADHNFKPWKHHQQQWDKLCAENNACSMAIVNGADYISAIVVTSHHKEVGKETEDATHSDKALHSCLNCRNLYRELIEQGIMSDETVVLFVDDGPLLYEDAQDTDPFIVDTFSGPVKVNHPRLKLLKREITENDVTDLPQEEMTMKKFLNLEIYQTDPKSEPGKTPPPYYHVLPG